MDLTSRIRTMFRMGCAGCQGVEVEFRCTRCNRKYCKGCITDYASAASRLAFKLAGRQAMGEALAKGDAKLAASISEKLDGDLGEGSWTVKAFRPFGNEVRGVCPNCSSLQAQWTCAPL